MTDRPIIFSGPMILALLAGRKTVTRRITDLKGLRWTAGDRLWVRENWRCGAGLDATHPRDVEGIAKPGPFMVAYSAGGSSLIEWNGGPVHIGGAKDHGLGGRIRPSIHMPRWASRLTLVVTEVAVQRLHDMAEEDAEAEGVCSFVEQHDRSSSWEGLSDADRRALVCSVYGSSRKAFQHLWVTLNGDEAWLANPWVAAIRFTVLRANIDELDIAARAA